MGQTCAATKCGLTCPSTPQEVGENFHPQNQFFFTVGIAPQY